LLLFCELVQQKNNSGADTARSIVSSRSLPQSAASNSSDQKPHRPSSASSKKTTITTGPRSAQSSFGYGSSARVLRYWVL